MQPITPQNDDETVIVSTLAGGEEEGFADGKDRVARFNEPTGIAMDAAGNLYVADGENHRIRKVTPAGVVSTLAGGKKGFADGEGSAARFNIPYDIVIDTAGNLYVADGENHRIRKVTPEGVVSTLAGSGSTGCESGGFADGEGNSARFHHPCGIAMDAAGNLYVADTYNNRIRKVTPEGVVSTLAGSKRGFADGEGSAARFYVPSGIAIDAAGNLYVADEGNHRIRKVTPGGVVSTLAGGGEGGEALIGQMQRHLLQVVSTLEGEGEALPDEAVEIARKVFSTLAGGGEALRAAYGIVTLPAGGDEEADFVEDNESIDESECAGFEDGQGSAALFYRPTGIAIDAAGNLYVADSGNSCIRKVTPKGEVSTLADGEGCGIAIDAAGNLYVADTYNHRIRKIEIRHP